MIVEPPKGLLGRAGAVTLLLCALGLIKLAIIDPITGTLQYYSDTIADADAELSRLTRLAGMQTRLDAATASLESQVEHSGSFLRADSAALAGAALQQRIKDAIGAEGALLNAIQWSGSKEDNGLDRVAVRVQMTATVGPLYRVLRAVEGTPPALFIDDIDITAEPTAGDPGASAQATPLSVSFECFGHWLSTAAAPAKTAP